ncbi:MAG: transcriptional repressor LexA [Ruminococcaceae bacterium]|nr:transcriptional repressor LexA [Oscillospiraceae bacterium]
MKELKPKELRVFEYIKLKIEEQGYAPSVREICADLNIKSTSTSQMYIDRLIDKGYLERENGKSRTLKLSQEVESTRAQNYKVPLLGQVAAGTPILTAENFDGYINFSTEKKYSEKDLFALSVKGESMKEIGIMNGDIVVVEKCDYADNGKIVVAMIDDEATVKRFFKENGKYRLQPENSEMKPIIADEVAVLGQVVASLRFYK